MYIKKIKSSTKGVKPFIVADIETILTDTPSDNELADFKTHVPYAAGYMFVHPNEKLGEKSNIISFYAMDFQYQFEDIEKMSEHMMKKFIEKLVEESASRKITHALVVYFHNLAKFDGLLILRHLALTHKDLILKPLIRNNRIYCIKIYKETGKSEIRRKLILKLHDSYLLLPSKLDDLAKSFCPEYGSKGSIEHSKVTVDSLSVNKDSYMEYMNQDIYLLGGVLKKAQ